MQQAQREEVRQSIQRQNQQEGQEIWELEQQLEVWKGRCPLCFIRGHISSRHSIEDCVQNGANDICERWKEMKKLMGRDHLFERFSCCYDCHVPQDICEKWIEKKEEGRWERGKRSCQFDNIIMPTVMTAMMEGKDWMIEIINGWIEKNGVKEKEQMYKLYGRKVYWGGIEVSNLIITFYRLVKGMEERALEGMRI